MRVLVPTLLSQSMRQVEISWDLRITEIEGCLEQKAQNTNNPKPLEAETVKDG